MTVANYDAPTLGESWPIWLEKATHQITQEVTFWSIATAFVMAVCFALLFGTFQRSVFWKPSAESWHDWFWRVLDIVILAAGVSAVIWSFFWSLGFVLLVLLSKRFGVPTETSALAISFAVLLGHLPKFASNLFGTDTDFEDFVARVGRHSLQDAHWARLFLASCIIVIMFQELIPMRLDQLVLPLEPTDFEAFVNASRDGAFVVLGLFLIQIIFSWPRRILTAKNLRHM